MKKSILVFVSAIMAVMMAVIMCFAVAGCSDEDKTLNGYDADGNLVEYDKAYSPFWEGKTVYNESVMFVKDKDGKITAKTMFKPTKVIAVRDLGLTIEYKEGEDYTYADGVFTLTKNSTIPYFTYNEVNYNEGKGITELTNEESRDLTESGINVHQYQVMWTEGIGIAMRQICITYEHNESDWSAMSKANKKWQSYQGDKLPKTMSKLKNKEQLKITIYGDSISSVTEAGVGASSAGIGLAPYFPNWTQGFEDALEYKFGAEVEVNNCAVGGWNSRQGYESAVDTIAKTTADLFIIAFGMNDGVHGISVSEYKKNLQGMINIMEKQNPDIEVVVIATTHRNLDMVWSSGEVSHEKYLPVIEELAEENDHVAVCDMTSFTEDLFRYKKSYECFYNNINHPIDYMVRAYVANMMKLFLE